MSGTPKISKIVIFFHIYCCQTGRNVKYTKQFFTNHPFYRTTIIDDWGTCNLPLFDCTPYNHINLRLYFDILEIQYEQNENESIDLDTISDYHKDIKMNHRAEYECISNRNY